MKVKKLEVLFITTGVLLFAELQLVTVLATLALVKYCFL